MTTIVTLGMDPASAAWFNAERQRFYPPALNRIPAHLSLFHALPGDASIRHVLQESARTTDAFRMQVTGLRSMGRGVLYTLQSPALMHLHKLLAGQFQIFLTPQDKQPLRPHVVVQNKVEPAEAKALLAELQARFTPREVQATGLDWWEYLGGPWRLLEHLAFAEEAEGSTGKIAARPDGLRVARVHTLMPEAQGVLQEYSEAVNVVQRDDPNALSTALENGQTAMWLAYLRDEVAGCVVLRIGVPEPGAGECKRLFVRPAHRGAGVAQALMEAMETFAREQSLASIYLDTNEAFAASVALYRRRGYRECPRYNNNPQATLFFRKQL